MNRTRLPFALLAGVVTALLAAVIILLLGATTDRLDGPLGIGTRPADESELSVMSLGGTGRTVLTHDPGMVHRGPACSPDGDSLVYTFGEPSRHASQVVVVRPDGAGRGLLTNNGRDNYLATWSPDGKWVANVSQRGTDTTSAEVMVSSADGSGVRQLTCNHT